MNVLAFGLPGTGKTHAMAALAYRLIEQGRSVLFAPTYKLVQDLMADREILSASVDLYMAMVSHRTNQVMRRLTTVSVIFLPLMFVCGVYGMNFTELPEIHWKYGYLFFWGLVAVIASSLALALKRARWL